MGRVKTEIQQGGDRSLCSWEKVAVSLYMDLSGLLQWDHCDTERWASGRKKTK